MTVIKECVADLSSTQIRYLRCGEADKPVLMFLHGFPENSWSWEIYLETLSGDYQVIAPDLPGYNLSKGFKSESEYHLNNLIATFSEFIEKLNFNSKIHLIAHDWGGVIAWPLTAFNADKIKTLTILNAAHPSAFTREMLSNPKQQSSSDYIADLISDNAFEITSKNDFAMLKALYAKGFQHLSERFKAALVRQWGDSNSMQQAFNYYKQMPLLHTRRLQNDVQGSKIPNIQIKVPTQVLWGMRDTAFVPEVLDGMENWIEKLTLIKFENSDHWLHHRQPLDIIQHIREFVESKTA